MSETKKQKLAFECANLCVRVCVCVCVCFSCVDCESLHGNGGWFVAWLCVFELDLWFTEADVWSRLKHCLSLVELLFQCQAAALSTLTRLDDVLQLYH